MKITDIKQQVKRSDRYSLYGDGKYIFSLSESELLNIGLKIGQEFSGKELENLKDTAVLDKAYDSCLNLISRRKRSEWEIAQYLKQKGYPKELAGQVINRLKDKSCLDDSLFAEAWINTRRILKNSSKRRLAQELRAKRVNDQIIQQALENDEADEREVLKELISKKQTQTRYQDKEKLMAYLLRQGYNYADIKEALD